MSFRNFYLEFQCFNFLFAWIVPFHALSSVDHVAVGSPFEVSLVPHHVHLS